MSQSHVKDTDKGFALYMKRAKKHAKHSGGVEIGVFDTSERLVRSIADKPATHVQVAAWMEFGNSQVPERSFLRSTADRNRKKYLELLAKAHDKALHDGADEAHLLRLIGEVGVADVKHTITSQNEGEWAALSDRTIQAKGSSQALIDTGQLLNSITSKVVEKRHAGGHGGHGHGGEE